MDGLGKAVQQLRVQVLTGTESTPVLSFPNTGQKNHRSDLELECICYQAKFTVLNVDNILFFSRYLVLRDTFTIFVDETQLRQNG